MLDVQPVSWVFGEGFSRSPLVWRMTRHAVRGKGKQNEQDI